MPLADNKDTQRTLVVVDGENLVFRFEAMAREGRRKNDQSLVYEPGIFVWHPHMATYAAIYGGLVRVSYYTSVVGDDNLINSVQEKLGTITYKSEGAHGRRICPHIFKKPKQSQKSKNVDIAIAIDCLRHTYQNHIDQLYLYSGDGDYLPLVREVMRQGKQVVIGAFSSGLSQDLKRAADSFLDLDDWGFLR